MVWLERVQVSVPALLNSFEILRWVLKSPSPKAVNDALLLVAVAPLVKVNVGAPSKLGLARGLLIPNCAKYPTLPAFGLVCTNSERVYEVRNSPRMRGLKIC